MLSPYGSSLLYVKYGLPSPGYSRNVPNQLSSLDVFVSTFDLLKEPLIFTANRVISILSVDYPVEKAQGVSSTSRHCIAIGVQGKNQKGEKKSLFGGLLRTNKKKMMGNKCMPSNARSGVDTNFTVTAKATEYTQSGELYLFNNSNNTEYGRGTRWGF
ncbi:hypothetical protein V6N13_146943 [Hibiscus sabdariffa]